MTARQLASSIIVATRKAGESCSTATRLGLFSSFAWIWDWNRATRTASWPYDREPCSSDTAGEAGLR
ncbi:hypothetical protein [Sporisorium scitamineum]|uniref:Uncharacterized protein n=1 Tax=Sporisorium scitamineum TaxID=49012 RepID=A0A0F7SCY7_9BASI|nr:hypothetical protein [Sporisorium scitamineum]